MVSTSVARILSLAFFLLSVAPLASLYALIAWFVWGSGGENIHVATLNAESSHLVLENPDATLEDLWAVVTENAVLLTNSRLQMHHLTILIPWAISLVLGVIVPCVLAIRTYIQTQTRHEDFDNVENWISRFNDGKERRLARLLLAVRNYTKIIKDEDFVEQRPSSRTEDCKLRLPTPGETCSTEQPSRAIAGGCAICLGQYASGDEVVWSSNPKCQHVFHKDCIVSWLLRKRRQQHCPCCRRLFLETKG